MTEKFEMVAKTLYGLEEVLAAELRELGADNIRPGRRMVAFEGDKRLLYKANLNLRTALRILKPILKFKAEDADQVYNKLSEFDWTRIMDVDKTFAVDPVIYSDHFHHSRFVSYRTKDAICDFFNERIGRRPSVRLHNPDILINIHISHDDVTVSLDSSGDSLHKRGYRVAQTDAPLNEVLAAGILKMAGWDDQVDLIDPMCGSGTFLIEAALMAANIAPGIYRSGFAFQSWTDYDEEMFMELYNDDSQERIPKHKIYGSDILPEAINIARKNVARAGLTRYIELEVMPMQQRPQPENKAIIVTNPPYGERLRLSDAEELYSMIGERLKHNYPGCNAWILAYRPEHFDSIGLRHSTRESLMNGSLECELRGYELFEGTMSDFRTDMRSRGEMEYHERKPNCDNAEGDGRKIDRKAIFNRRFEKDDSDRNRRPGRRFERDDRSREGRFERREGRQNRFDRFSDDRRNNRWGDRERDFRRDDEGFRSKERRFDDRSDRRNSDWSERPGRVITSFSDGLAKDVRNNRPYNRQDSSADSDRSFDRDDRRNSKNGIRPDELKRTRRRVGEYRSGKVSQREELAKIDRIRSRRNEDTSWPKDRKFARQRQDDEDDPFSLIEDQFRESED